MASVYRARDRETDVTVALKVLHPGQAEPERFLREAEILAQLRVPGIVRHIAHGAVPGGGFYLALEWIEGESLSERLKRSSLLPHETAALARRVAEALGAIHALGIVHRDVKPGNIMLPGGDVNRVTLVDFGIARLESQRLTRTGWIMGTPWYMAPEQVRGERSIGPPADIFSLGCVLHECLVGSPPFEGDHPAAVLAKVLVEPAPRLGTGRLGIPTEVEALVATMLEKQPARRPQSGRALVDLLDALPTEWSGRNTLAVGSSSPSTALSISREEQRFLAVILLGQRDANCAETLDVEVDQHLRLSLRELATRHGARFEPMVDGSQLVVFDETGAVSDLAIRATQCALALGRVAGSDCAVSLVVGLGQVADGGVPAGEVIDRAAALMASGSPAPAAGVLVDTLTAELVASRFDMAILGEVAIVRGERAHDVPVRQLLGRPAPFVGRDAELEQLLVLVRTCVAEQEPRVVLVTGEPGMGKSRLLHELIQRLRDRGEPVQVWNGRADAVHGGSPYALFVQVLQRRAGIHPDQPIAERWSRLRGWMAKLVPEWELAHVQAFLGELAGTSPPERDIADPAVQQQLRAARRDPEMMGEQILQAGLGLLAGASRSAPLVLVFEDLHWADRPTLKLVERAVKELADRPLFVLGLARPNVHELFPELRTRLGVQEVALRPLGRRACERLVSAALPDQPPAVIARLIEHAEGNAFYLEELVRACAAGKDQELPETVLAMAGARLEALSPEARRALRAASIFGETFWAGGLAALLGGDAALSPLSPLLAELVDDEILTRRTRSRFSGDAEYGFRHALLRDAAYAMLTPEDRALGHRLAAGWLAQAKEGDASVLAEHLLAAGEPASAQEHLLAAAHRARALHASEEAIELLRRALEIAQSEPALARDVHAIRLDLADLLALFGHREEAMPLYSEVCGATDDPRAWQGRASILRKRGEHEAAVQLLEGIIGTDRISGKGVARLCLEYGWNLAILGRNEQAIETFRAGLAALGEQDVIAGHILIQMARTEMDLERHEQALAHALEAQALFEREEDLRALPMALRVLGGVYNETGRLDEAAATLARGLEVAERVGAADEIAGCLINLGFLASERDDLTLAIEQTRRGIDYCERSGHEVGRATGYANLAEYYEQRGAHGDHEAALQACSEALAICEQGGMRSIEAEARHVMGRLLADHRPADAAPWLERSAELYLEVGDRSRAASTFSLAAAALDAAGDRERAASLRARADSVKRPAS